LDHTEDEALGVIKRNDEKERYGEYVTKRALYPDGFKREWGRANIR
jgi:hypothetical protein